VDQETLRDAAVHGGRADPRGIRRLRCRSLLRPAASGEPETRRGRAGRSKPALKPALALARGPVQRHLDPLVAHAHRDVACSGTARRAHAQRHLVTRLAPQEAVVPPAVARQRRCIRSCIRGRHTPNGRRRVLQAIPRCSRGRGCQRHTEAAPAGLSTSLHARHLRGVWAERATRARRVRVDNCCSTFLVSPTSFSREVAGPDHSARPARVGPPAAPPPTRVPLHGAPRGAEPPSSGAARPGPPVEAPRRARCRGRGLSCGVLLQR